MTPDDVRTLLIRFTAAYGRKHPDTQTIAEWHHQLNHVDPRDAHLALDRHIKTGGKGPSLAEFMALIPKPLPKDIHPAPRYEPPDTERQRVAVIQADIAEQLANMKYGSRRR